MTVTLDNIIYHKHKFGADLVSTTDIEFNDNKINIIKRA